ncbi:hypothetical protein GUJ93_ZPchr0007g4604 [Zizania palustris]|uniref:RING-type domain-containing protein n=1 Tax=Zizania palustris TaxID=103762 RepID=A0A8J5W654_ZIZPA|nr:hypothetical protein GUJ93_ZPchr0007g4604 [Zizania palustris]
MASANGDDRTAAGILRLLLGMAMGPSVPMPEGRLLMVQHYIIDGDGDLFSGGIGGGVPPASKAAIAALKEVQAGEDGDAADSLGECAICLDAFGAGKEMPCGHRFHGECLERWLGVHGSCPVCRRELPAAEQPEEQNGGAEAREIRRPRGAVVVSYLVLGDGAVGEERRREEPWTIWIEDVD